jgi:hypothetical protein
LTAAEIAENEGGAGPACRGDGIDGKAQIFMYAAGCSLRTFSIAAALQSRPRHAF